MVKRPSAYWREFVAEEAEEVAAGRLDVEEAYCAQLFPEVLLVRTDEVLGRFEGVLAAVRAPSDEEVFGLVKDVVLELNEVEADMPGSYETAERERLCEYIEESLVAAGIDVDGVAKRHGLTRHEITDEWREW